MGNLSLEKKKKLSSFRRIAIGTWRTAYDPQVYGSVTLRMDEALRYIEAFRQATGEHLTVTHMMAKVVGKVLEAMPDANAILRFNRIYVRKDIGVFFQVAMADERTGEIDLSGVTVRDPEQKSLKEIIEDFSARAAKVRAGKDKELESTRKTFKSIPFALLNFVLKALSFFTYTLNLDLRWAGVPKDPFGSAMVTNIGSIGLEEAYPPLVPYSRVPLLISMGAVTDAPVVEDGQLKVGKAMRIFATFDHRILDGTHAARMVKILKAWFEDPFTHFDAVESLEVKAKATEPDGAGVGA